MSESSGPGDTTLGVPDGERPGTRIGPFTIVRLLGEGGFGAVYEATQEQPVRRRVALKVIKLGMDTREVVARFEAERQALALMDHPHVARVFDAGATETGRPYFVMELVDGESITKFCIAHGLTIEQRLDVFGQVCEAVRHAHAKGIIHRDLKPNNVLVSAHDGRPFAKVIDFGIAKATRGRLTDKTLHTEQNLMMGSPAYMSPEQAEGCADVDARTDVYALGVILYELLTDTKPIASDSLREAAYGELLRIIRDADPPLPSARLLQSAKVHVGEGGKRSTEPRKLAGIVRGELDWIVMKAIEKDRTRRYQSASDLADDLLRYRSGQPVVAAPPAFGYGFRKFVRRHRSAFAVGALVAGTAIVTFLATHRSGADAPAVASTPAGSLSGKATVAVLPFESLSSDKDSAYFADGMQDTILTRLAGIGGLKTISRTSTAKYASHPQNLKAIARELGATTVLEGSVQKAGHEVLINVQLIDARSDQHLWAATYKRTLDNVFDVEGEVAQHVAEALDAKLSAAERRAASVKPTSVPAAYDAYLRGLAYARRGESGMVDSAVAFESAVHEDPRFASAWSWLSRQNAWIYFTGDDRSEPRRRRAQEAMDAVERLAPGSLASLLAQGYYRYRVERDYEGARQFFERARILSPDDVETLWPLAMIARRQAQWRRSIDLQEQAMTIDPRDELTMGGAIYTYLAVRDTRNAMRIVDRYRAFASSVPDALSYQCTILLQSGDVKAIGALIGPWTAGHPGDTNEWIPLNYYAYARDYPAGMAHMKGLLATDQDPFDRAQLQIALGDLSRLSGNAAAARSVYAQAQASAQAVLKKDPDNVEWLLSAARAEAGLGDRTAAITYARHAIAVDERLEDSYSGPQDLDTLTRVQARFGDKDEAIAALGRLLAIQYEDPVTVSTLRVDPDWDGLRDDPRFQKLLRDHASDKPGT